MTTTLILGKQGRKKTKLANEMVANKNSVYFSRLDEKNFKLLEDNTEVILIDELNLKDIPFLKAITSRKEITFRKPYARNTTTINMPDIIAMSNSLTEEDFDGRRRIKLITV